MQEIILAAAGPTSASQGSGCVSLYDIHTGTSLVSFKQTSAGVHGTTTVATKNEQGGLVLAAQSEKSLLNVYTYQKVADYFFFRLMIGSLTLMQDQLHMRIVVPEKLSCIATDTWGHLCAAGTQSGRVYMWEVCYQFLVYRQSLLMKPQMCSGILFNSFEAHYRRITTLKFTPDGSALISCSEDSGISVWSIPRYDYIS